MLEHERVLAIISSPVFPNMRRRCAVKKKLESFTEMVTHISFLVGHPANVMTKVSVWC